LIGDQVGLKSSKSLFVVISIIFIAVLPGGINAAMPDGHDPAYWKPVEQAMGKNGTLLQGGVFKIDLTRETPKVMIGNVTLKPGMAMDSWVSFMSMGGSSMMMGDIVLTVDEMRPVQEKLSMEGIDITAVHNTVIGASPQVYDLHISGNGDPVEMAKKVRTALDRISWPREATIPPGPIDFALDRKMLDNILGYRGTMEGGVYAFTIPRAETIAEGGMEIPPTMDVASIVKFQAIDRGNAAITGDFILRPEEVKPVIKALNENGIVVTALHTHMLTEEPRMFFLHFWATGDAVSHAKGLRLAIDQTNSLRA
jgi:hypothetical protein